MAHFRTPLTRLEEIMRRTRRLLAFGAAAALADRTDEQPCRKRRRHQFKDTTTMPLRASGAPSSRRSRTDSLRSADAAGGCRWIRLRTGSADTRRPSCRPDGRPSTARPAAAVSSGGRRQEARRTGSPETRAHRPRQRPRRVRRRRRPRQGAEPGPDSHRRRLPQPPPAPNGGVARYSVGLPFNSGSHGRVCGPFSVQTA